jgi:cell wall-associated NlpC family hydrolase
VSSVAAPIPGARAGRRAGAAALVGLALFLLVVIGGLAGGQVGPGSFAPSAVAIADIPANYLAAYQSAAARYGVDWAILAAIGRVECDHGRNRAPGCNPPGSVNGAGATGPMQFLGSTWRRGTAPMAVPTVGPPTISVGAGYATDGDDDRLADVWNPADAIAGAARLLRSNGAPDDYSRAIYAYNHAGWYVDRVMAQADEYRGTFAPGATGGARTALTWAVSHVGRFTYSLGPPTDRGASVQDMQTREPSGSTCDCSMFVRWSMAQAGMDGETAVTTPLVSRGVGSSAPTGGYRPGDIIFFGHGPGGDGHDALWLGDGQIVQCSSSGGGSNIRPLAGYVAATGWVRWTTVSGG